ncbi:hypothetical protein DYB32_009189 [Aphanomyces invadans]|uniref:RanBP2-type domain-containing protein n=1 Tax=Aphanomyces invadans TaxID=157072 RepID=A0A418AJ06_9STRA|nr:hypothetical protein DYB32_009189 [Aphanomyces invadans]
MMGGGPPPRLGADGDWVCPKEGCGNINFARRMECNRCFTPRLDAPKKQFGDRSFEKKTGLFGPGDWACGKCGNMNWERRNECNICKAPKSSLGPDEKRDGAGGGFNERQDRVASARREVADDGYDDFGQRRQKATVSQKDREAAALARLKASYSAIYTNEPSAQKEIGVAEVPSPAIAVEVRNRLTDDAVRIGVAVAPTDDRVAVVIDMISHRRAGAIAAVGRGTGADRCMKCMIMFRI